MLKKPSLLKRAIVGLLLVGLVTSLPPVQVSADVVSWTSGGQPTLGSTIGQTKENYSWCLWGKGVIYNNSSPQDMCLMQGVNIRLGILYNQAYLSVGSDATFYPFSGVSVGGWDSAKLIPGTDTLIVRDYISTSGRGLSLFKNLSNKVIKNGTTYELNSQADFTLKNPDNSLMSVKTVAYSLNGNWLAANADIGTIRINTQDYGLKIFAESHAEDPYLSISNDGDHAVRFKGSYARVYDIDTTCGSADLMQVLNSSQVCANVDFSSLVATLNSDPNIWLGPIVFSPNGAMFTIYYWVNAEGLFKIVDIYAPNYIAVDADSDGLSLSREEVIGTSDTIKDTDGDGLSDYIESRWYPDRDGIFCGVTECSYPNPIVKDMYVEVDWIHKNLRDYKPTATQISKVIDAFNDQNIIAHFDIGQYGGGNQLPTFSGGLTFIPTENKMDFYDLKNGVSTISSNFNPNRKGVWRYMVTSPNFIEYDNNPGTTGISFAGDDDSMISIEKVENENPANLDTAIAGTMLHELGHNLCLSDESMYTGHAPECIYSEIDKDNNPSVDYESVMNYTYQLSMVDYSHGINGSPDDHNDWLAVSLGMNDFTTSQFEWQNIQSKSSKSKNIDRSRMIQAIQR